MITQILVNIHRVLNIISIELYSPLTYWTIEHMTHKFYIIIIDINIGKHFLQGYIDNISRFDKLIYSLCILSSYNILLALGIFAVNMLCYSFVNRYRKNEFLVIRTCLYLFHKPALIGKETTIYISLSDIINSKGNFLILIILIIVVIRQIISTFCSNDSFHEFHGRIILS